MISSTFPSEVNQEEAFPFGAKSPLWYLRLTHTRLADSILELCGVPPKDMLRQACLRIFSEFTTPAPSCLSRFLPSKAKKTTKQLNAKDQAESLGRQLSDAVQSLGLPVSAADNLRILIVNGCLPLPPDIGEAMTSIQSAVSQLRQRQVDLKADNRRLKRFDEVGRSLKSLKNLVDVMEATGIAPLFGRKTKNHRNRRLNPPLYISLDLGLRQRRRHYHGQTLFQCIALPNDYFDKDIHNECDESSTVCSPHGQGSKIAEGGRYDDLVSSSSYCRRVRDGLSFQF